MAAAAPRPVFTHVATHEAGHAVLLKSLLGETPPPREIDPHVAEPRAWDDVFERLMAGEPPPDATRVTAFVLGGSEALVHAAGFGRIGASRYHGLNGPDGSGCDAELVDEAVMRHGADRWRAVDLAREAVRRDWSVITAVAAEIARTWRIDPSALAPLLARVGPV